MLFTEQKADDQHIFVHMLPHLNSFRARTTDWDNNSWFLSHTWWYIYGDSYLPWIHWCSYSVLRSSCDSWSYFGGTFCGAAQWSKQRWIHETWNWSCIIGWLHLKFLSIWIIFQVTFSCGFARSDSGNVAIDWFFSVSRHSVILFSLKDLGDHLLEPQYCASGKTINFRGFNILPINLMGILLHLMLYFSMGFCWMAMVKNKWEPKTSFQTSTIIP